jgi:hypothetical protein
MYELVFSILAHEAPDVLENQIENIKKWNVNKKFLICLHLNDYMYKNFKTKDKCVIINTDHFNKRLYTADVLVAHLKNVLFLKEKGIQYKSLMLLASNVMFIKKFNIDEHQPTIQIADTLYEVEKPYVKALQKDKGKDIWIGWRHLSGYPDLIRFFTEKKIPLSAYQNEGRIYTRELIEKITDFIIKNNIINYIPGVFLAEEILLPSLENYFCNGSIAKCYCKIFWHNSNYQASIKDIDDIINDNNSEFFMVKRVLRVINDPIRIYINNLPVK